MTRRIVLSWSDTLKTCQRAGFPVAACLALPLTIEEPALDQLLTQDLGGLEWLRRHRDLRRNPEHLLPGARSILITLVPQPRVSSPGLAASMRGPDYHRVLRKKLSQLGKALAQRCQQDASGASRAVVDSAPLAERHLAVVAGLGWIGKSGMLIHPDLGGRVWIASLLTTFTIEPSNFPIIPSRCGACTRCQDACPTGSITAQGVQQLTCLSYLTLEHHGPLPSTLFGRWCGCDTCLDACPFNSPAIPIDEPSLETLKAMDQETWEKTFAGSIVRRLGFERFQRNLNAQRD